MKILSLFAIFLVLPVVFADFTPIYNSTNQTQEKNNSLTTITLPSKNETSLFEDFNRQTKFEKIIETCFAGICIVFILFMLWIMSKLRNKKS